MPNDDHFNSIKVQLKRRKFRNAAKRALFQFHKGTIKTESDSSFAVKERDFNSIKVQLKPPQLVSN